jgi:hypothetical protein
MDTEQHRRILSNALAATLAKAGVIEEPDDYHKIVIVLEAGEPVMIYAERFGDERLLNVALTLDGVEVTVP